MKILFLTRKWPPAMGGMETYCFELVRELEHRHDLTLHVLLGHKDGGAPRGIELVRFGIATALRLIGGRGGHEVIHGGDMSVWPLVWVARLRSPRAVAVLSAHGSDVAYAGRPGILPRLYGNYMRLGAVLLRRAKVLANSNATADRARSLGFAHVHVIHLATNIAAEAPPKTPGRYILFAGRLIKSKGLSWFVEVVLPQLPSDITLKVAGTVWDERERGALSVPRVEFLGPQAEDVLHDLMAGALCLIVPNIAGERGDFEGFGLVAVEGAAAGGIVLASRIHGLIDAVIDGETGYHLPPQSAPDWIAAIERIAKLSPEMRAEFVARSRDVAREHYSWGRVARETEESYTDVLS